MTAPQTVLTATLPPGDRPRDEEIDLFGMTHVGRVRLRNEDHFLLCTLHHSMTIHGTSLASSAQLPLQSQRLATVAMVADGVGGAAAGFEASRLAVSSVANYVGSAIECLTSEDPGRTDDFRAALERAVLRAHDAVLARAATSPELHGMATTLTLMISTWPHAYVVQVGDSRCYYWNEDGLQCMTHDQTVAQDLVDAGMLPANRAAESPLANVLSSALGGREARPAVSSLTVQRGCAMVLCTDGLTKHVSDDEIAAHLRAATSSEQVARALVDLALERGGTDNVTVLVGRAPRAAVSQD
jgi:protein phosphatase